MRILFYRTLLLQKGREKPLAPDRPHLRTFVIVRS